MQESSDYQVAAPLALRHEPVQAYERREMPEVEPVLRSLARQCPSFRKFPLLRILKDIARLFLLTQTEALFLQYVVRETEWGTGEAWIRVYAGRVKDLLCFLYEEQEYQQLVLYLLLASYSVKECLNGRQPSLLRRAAKICPDFNTAFREWSVRHTQTIREIHPRMLNRLYCQLWQEGRQPQSQEQPDYMIAVDQILEICRPYSETRVESQKERMKALKREAETGLWEQKSHKRRKMEKKTEVVELCSSFTEVEFDTRDVGEQVERCLSELQDPFKKEAVGLPDSVTNSDEQYCESFNLCPEERQQDLRIFIKKDPDYDHYSLRFICDDSEPHLL